MKSNFTLIELLVCLAIVIILIITLAIPICVGVGGCFAYKHISKEGLKPTIERVWEGESPSSTDSEIFQ